MNIIVYVLIIVLLIYAVDHQKREYKDTFIAADDTNHNSPKQLLKSIKICLASPQKAIKWRVVFISMIIIVALIFFLVHSRLPTDSEFIMYSIIVYTVIYCMLIYIHSVHRETYLCGVKNLKRLNKKLI